MRPFLALGFLLATVAPVQAVPLRLPDNGWLTAPTCRWTETLLAPGPYTPGCHVETASIGAVDPHAGGPVGQPETPGGRMWFTVESQGHVWQEERWAKGWDTELFTLPFIQGLTRLTFATERELRTYQFVIDQPPLSHTPEPATLLLMGVSAAVAGWRMRKTRR